MKRNGLYTSFPKVLLLYKIALWLWTTILTLKLLVDFLENSVFYGNCTGARPPPFFFMVCFHCVWYFQICWCMNWHAIHHVDFEINISFWMIFRWSPHYGLGLLLNCCLLTACSCAANPITRQMYWCKTKWTSDSSRNGGICHVGRLKSRSIIQLEPISC